MERAILFLFLSVPALVAGPAEPTPEISYQRLQVVTPANPDQTYQSFSKSLEAYSIRTIMFMYPKDRSIVQYQFITVSGTGNVRHMAGGRDSNSLTIRAENSGARVFNYMVNIYTVLAATTTESMTTTTTESPTTTTTESPTTTTTESTTTTTTESPTTTTESPTTTTESPTTTTESPTTTTTESMTTTTESMTTTTESLITTTTESDAPPEEDDDIEGSGLPEEDNENSPEVDDTEGSGTTTTDIPATTCICTCG